jgi:hypothetical protein
MRHPIDELRTENGEIFRISGVTRSPYMNTPAITITDRLGVQQVAGTEYCFRFQLSGRPCEVWQQILQTVLETFQVNFVSNTLELVCIPANLESRFETLKNKIAETNRIYEAQRKSLIIKIGEKQKQDVVAAKAAQQTEKQVQKIFDDLKL